MQPVKLGAHDHESRDLMQMLGEVIGVGDRLRHGTHPHVTGTDTGQVRLPRLQVPLRQPPLAPGIAHHDPADRLAVPALRREPGRAERRHEHLKASRYTAACARGP